MSLVMKPDPSFRQFPLFMLLLFTACSHVKTDHYPNGNIRSEITIKGDHYNGPALFYYNDGILMMECNYLNDSLEGLLTRYHENGAKKEILYYKMNKPDSICKRWNAQGQLLEESFYHDGLLEGNYRNFYDNGQMKSSGEYRTGQPIGLWLFYDQNGYVVHKENY